MVLLKLLSSRMGSITTRRGLSTSSQYYKGLKTCLHDFHLEQGAKMIPFAGYDMPIEYRSEKIAASHLHTRKHCSIFDVSHMLQSHVHGKDRIELIEALTVADVQGLKENSGTLSVLTNARGGIIDDLIITKTDSNKLYVVTNAGCKYKDIPLLQGKEKELRAQGKDVTLELLDDRGLVALQGPEGARVMQGLMKEDLSKMLFMTTIETTVAGVDNCRVTRCGYTGEDGFEISVPADSAVALTTALLESKAGTVHLAGLAARDSLRLEAGLCLYGNDLNEDTTPIEAGLTWTIGKRRRVEKGFPGADIILQQLKDKPKVKRVGLLSTGPPARANTPIVDATTGERIGEVTSGCPAPSLPGHNVAMGYVQASHSKSGTKVQLEVRKKKVDAAVAKMPFIKANYYTKVAD